MGHAVMFGPKGHGFQPILPEIKYQTKLALLVTDRVWFLHSNFKLSMLSRFLWTVRRIN